MTNDYRLSTCTLCLVPCTFVFMNIGYDAKRAFHNTTGLGHYSRTLLRSLAARYPQHQYYLFNPKPSSLFELTGKNIHEVGPGNLILKTISSLWRSSLVKKDLQKRKIDLYHGLSNEIPLEMDKINIPSVVTIHDLIFERHPEQYAKVDVEIYKRKFSYACRHATKVIAISEQTKRDILDFYKIPENKIAVCYQSCDPAFAEKVTEQVKQQTREKYQLPEKFLLYVGSVIERKNLLMVCKALLLLKNEIQVPLVVIGDGTAYKKKVQDYIRENGLEQQVIFLSDHPLAKVASSFLRAEDFPAIYQMASAMLYPSFFEGFGIPVLEALWSRLPVITSRVSSLPEAGGDGACYVNPASAVEMAEAMKKILQEPGWAAELAEKGWQHAQRFTNERTAAAVMGVYQSVW